MNFVKSFFKNTISTPVRFILSTLVWIVICTLLLIGLSLQHVADNASSNAKKSIGSTVTLIAKQKKSY
ncbi:ABC transporter permease [Brochothrix thermosphacta DSM 20171 = FSL F6-1036]|nr:ABC transporter permease [Brochothrix thermosphacta DSM 20171 = FSL F6-1036]